MKKTLIILAALAVVGFVVVPGFAAEDTQDVTCTVNGLADAITAPADVELTCDRLGSAESATAGTITYGTEASTRDVTVQASVGSGTPVVGATLSIKSTSDLPLIASYTLLADGSDCEDAVTLKENVAAADPGTTLADDIYLKLDATGVAAGAANLGTAWHYTLTYTIADL